MRGIIMKDVVKFLLKNKKSIWDFMFPSKIAGRKANLGGVGPKALTVKLESSKDYPNLEIKGFLNWDKWDSFTDKEKALIQVLLNELESNSSS